MRILVDYRPALRARTGVGEYIHTLVVRLYRDARRRGDAVHELLEGPAVFLSGARASRALVDRRVPVSVLNYLWHRLEWPAVETLGDFDVVHAAHPLLIPSRRAAQDRNDPRSVFPPESAAHARRDPPRLCRARGQPRTPGGGGHHVVGIRNDW